MGEGGDFGRGCGIPDSKISMRRSVFLWFDWCTLIVSILYGKEGVRRRTVPFPGGDESSFRGEGNIDDGLDGDLSDGLTGESIDDGDSAQVAG